MGNKADQEFHIVIFPSATSRPRRFSVKRRTVRVLLLATVVAVVLEALFLVQYVTRSGEIWELETLRSEATQHRQQATSLSSAMEELRKQLSNMREVNVRLRVMLGLDPPKIPPSPLGLGGKEESRVVHQSAGGMGGDGESLSAVVVQLQQKLTWLKEEAIIQERYLHELTGIVGERRAQWASTPSIWPVRGWVSSGFGRRVSPFTGEDTLHSGLDISAPMSTPVKSPAAGTVIAVGPEKSLGNVVVLAHGYGFKTLYAHMSKVRVRRGQIVKRGDIIGEVGNTGLSTGPHLHYEIELKGTAIDPLRYIID
ncbi:MAG TPA: M23 family metallopeptidase [Nitrospirales bacterium]|jgi:murein DD-endopeptidase MepM/ murein hydrolase activator NlpD|nr:M23 family metallopeptidase [Nitrospirales bacterium]